MKRLLFLVACIMILGLVSSSVWGSIGSGDDSEIIFNSPADANITLTLDVVFNCSANVTGGSILKNMSLYTNQSGTWEAKNTTTSFSSDYVVQALTTEAGYLTQAQTGRYGSRFTTKTDAIQITNVSKSGSSTATTAYICSGETGTTCAETFGTATFVGNLATFTSPIDLNASTTYKVVADKGGASYNRVYKTRSSVVDNTLLSWISAEGGYTNEMGQIFEMYAKLGIESSTETWTRRISESTLWACGACDSDGDCGFTVTNRTVYVDTTLPQITVQSPSGTTDYNYIGGNETLNVTFDDNGLDMCWYNYNGTNITIDGCLTGTSNSTNFTLESDNTNMTIYSNDSFGNENSTFINWTYTYLENNRTYNTTSYETAGETFSINVEGASSVTLLYNGTSYTTTKSGNDFTRTLQMPIGKLGNHKIIFSLDETQSSYTSYQNVLEVMFTLCNSNYTTKFLNISFKDETNSSALTASIPTSTFNYYLGDGTVYKTYTYINNTENTNYEFCASPNRALYVDELIQYKSSGYPQRIYDQSAISLSNTITNTILYLLSSIDGIYVTFQVYSGQSAALEGVEVTSTRIIDGSTSIVAQGTTDAAGSVTFWLSPDFSHINTFVLTGYETTILSIFPTQSLYTVTMGGGTASTIIDNAEGVTTTTSPSTTFLDANTFYTFNYTISSSTLTLSEYGMNLTYDNGTVISLQTGSISTGGTLDFSFNTSNNTKLQMSYYYITNSTKINGSTYWLIIETNNYSIYHFFTRISTFISANIFGILGDDDGYFAKAMISILIIIMVTGVISSRYGLGSEAAVTGIMFGIVFMLNLFDMIPNPDFLTLISLGDFLVVFIALLAIGLIIKEETR